ncbi:MAG: cytochrome c [Bryobacterales bacterium]|nr:cytochrome c [Bryobacterales bacterium]
MALTSYALVRPWAAAIRESVLTGKMPPWDAKGPTAHTFQNDRSLTESETATLVSWAEAGAPEGQPVKTTFQPARSHDGWKLGNPDVVIRMPGFTVPPSGQLGYRYLIEGGRFPRDVWIRAAEWRIDQRSVVHHVNAYVRAPGSSYLADYPKGQMVSATVADRARRREGERLFDRRQQIVGWEPGYEPMPWLADGAKMIPAGSDIVFEIHYNPNGKQVTDHSELGLYFADAKVKERVLAIDTLRDLDLAIPAGERDYVSKASMTVALPVKLLSVQPHMHYRGSAMEVRAVYPDGEAEVLVSVPKYDFNWQTTYVLREPKTIPAGTRLESVAHFDNSPNNAFNPDPGALIHWGDQTIDEMHIAFLELALPIDADPEKLLAAPPRMIGTPPGK